MRRVVSLLMITGAALLYGVAGSTQAIQAETKEADKPLVYIDAVSTDAERYQLQELLDEAVSTLKSDAFRTNLLALKTDYPKIFAHSGLPDASPERILKLLNAEEPNTRIIRVPVALIGSEAYNDGSGNFNYTARTGSTHWSGEEPVGSMSLGRVTMYRYKQENLVDKSCAINTVAHEMTHTISRVPGKYVFAISDTSVASRTDKSSPLASYLVGAVAQCTWLQQKKRIPSTGISACVKVFGTQNFNSARCSQFTPGQEERWLGLFEQRLAKDKWNVCRFRCSAEMGRLAGRA